jgi:CheY-like chemotaxis protein/DNA-binding MarR family transcriptional regulator
LYRARKSIRSGRNPEHSYPGSMNTRGKSIQDGDEIDVLVVDDDDDAVAELVQFLSRARLTCKSAGDGWAALQLLTDGCRPQVIVSDLRMPELDGMEFVDRIGRVPGIDRPEIIFVSGHAGFDDAVAALRLGARDMLTKPIDGPKLVQAVKSAQLARQLRLRPQAPSGSSRPPSASPLERRRDALNDLKAVRRLRSKYFPSDLFSDPCWEMLLDLYDAHLSEVEVTVTSLGAASGVPQTTALRRMDVLQSHGLIGRSEDKVDQRRTIIKLTDAGLSAVEEFFETYLGRRVT